MMADTLKQAKVIMIFQHNNCWKKQFQTEISADLSDITSACLLKIVLSTKQYTTEGSLKLANQRLPVSNAINDLEPLILIQSMMGKEYPGKWLLNHPNEWKT